MRDKKVIVTGASGFIGGYLCKYLYYCGYKVTGWGRRKCPPAGWHEDIPYYSVDLCETIPAITDVYAVVHVAGLADDTGSRQKFMQINVHGTQNLMEAISRPCGFIYISSASVYPCGSEKALQEDDAIKTDSLSAYGFSKLVAEELIREYGDKLDWTCILRPRAVYGPGDTTLLPRILQLKKGNIILFPGKGLVQISMTHVLNVCDAVRLSLEQKSNGVFNIADKNAYSLRTVIREIFSNHTRIKCIYVPLLPLRLIAGLCSALKIKSRINHQSLDYLNKPLILDISKAKSKLGYSPEYSFSGKQVLN